MTRNTNLVYSNGKWIVTSVCNAKTDLKRQARKIPPHELPKHLPFDDKHTQVYKQKILGLKAPDFILKSGDVYDGHDGHRLIYEVGCDSIIYTMIGPSSSEQFTFFIQATDGFIFDVTSRSIAAKVSKATKPIVTIAKYEMYFILGALSTISLSMLVLITGTDITLTGISTYSKAMASKKLSLVLLAEYHNLKTYAPTLHSKFNEYLEADNEIRLNTYGKTLANNIVTDEKVQAQLAGVLTGKATIATQPFTAWTAIFTILLTGVINAITKSVSSYADTVNNRYSPIVKDLKSIDWDNPTAISSASNKIITIFKEAGVNVTPKEAASILIEVRTNSNQLEKSIRNIADALETFEKETK